MNLNYLTILIQTCYEYLLQEAVLVAKLNAFMFRAKVEVPSLFIILQSVELTANTSMLICLQSRPDLYYDLCSKRKVIAPSFFHSNNICLRYSHKLNRIACQSQVFFVSKSGTSS